ENFVVTRQTRFVNIYTGTITNIVFRDIYAQLIGIVIHGGIKFKVKNMYKTKLNIIKIDCPSEEQLIRMKLQDFDTVKSLEFDIPNRELNVYHSGNPEPILSALETLNLNTTLISTEETDGVIETDTSKRQRRLLWTVLVINFVFFGVEMLFG